ncbi:IS3 family transposase [Neisseria subflava]|uniref:IS3 family transposase n=2 Tax=Neisseria TaxID=482 RepID=UPI0023587BB7|nr:IS3 family transposase [Neisseria sp. KH1003-01]
MGGQTGLIWNQTKSRLKTFQTAFFIHTEIEEYLVYYNQKRIKLGLKGLSPV